MECGRKFISYELKKCSNAGVAPEQVRAVLMHYVHRVVEIPKHNIFPIGFDLEQVIYIAQVGYIQHEIVGLGSADILVQLFRQAVERQIC